MTVEEYINNPSGGRVGGLEREAYKSAMNKRLDIVLVRENANIKYHCYKPALGGGYWLYMKVPSEKIKDFYYDVVLKFNKPASAINMGNASLTKYEVQFFSNDPAFMYTHAYVYNKNNLFVPELKKKMPNIALRNRPVETNLHEVITYCKSIYWAIIIAKQKGLFVKDAYTETLDLKALLKQIEPADIHTQKRQELDVPKKKEKTKNETPVRTRTKAVVGSSGVNFHKGKTLDFSMPKSSGKKLGKINFNKSKKV